MSLFPEEKDEDEGITFQSMLNGSRIGNKISVLFCAVFGAILIIYFLLRIDINSPSVQIFGVVLVICALIYLVFWRSVNSFFKASFIKRKLPSIS